MKKLAILFSLLIFCFSVAYSLSQNNKYKLRGVFKTPDSSVIPVLLVNKSINGEKSWAGVTDINGNFEIELAPGDYELTVSEEISTEFKAFIKIEENGLNPNFLEFVIEPKPLPCKLTSGEDCPKIIKSFTPKYPPAARAVRASGRVEVIAKIDKDGNVSSAKAISGHALLRTNSEQAAKQITFEISKNSEERDIKLTFDYIYGDTEKENLKRYFAPYRIVVNQEYIAIDNSSIP